MKQSKIFPNVWSADEGKTFIRKSDNVDMGDVISLGNGDSINNYEEVTINE